MNINNINYVPVHPAYKDNDGYHYKDIDDVLFYGKNEFIKLLHANVITFSDKYLLKCDKIINYKYESIFYILKIDEDKYEDFATITNYNFNGDTMYELRKLNNIDELKMLLFAVDTNNIR